MAKCRESADNGNIANRCGDHAMTDEVQITQTGGVVEIMFNRISKKNALNLAMYEAMAGELNAAAENPEVRAVLFWGAGKYFSSGNDLKDFTAVLAAPKALIEGDNAIVRFLTALERFPKPAVAAVEGSAVGVGTTLLLHCDLVYSAKDAEFSLPFANLGLRPENASSYLLPKLVGHPRAAEWLLLGEAFDASDAEAAGLVNRLVDDPVAYAREQCEKLCRQPPKAMIETKALLKAADRKQVATSFGEEMLSFTDALNSAEFAEAVAAFFEKRPADFSKL
ncbi:enoyl-CoA hydratase [Teredinibacter franksiae]|uniref:enoyl-CoA hydratase n=1 Tax=Teredinibacter franksiae TaxID=2761453 RepID=UPI001FEB6B43|nr:enoyl-CoA hydratase [Teredinibacter franksiae]